MSKILTLAAAATGYVLGARAGRERYEQIAGQAQRIWHDPRVRRAASNAKQTAAEKAPGSSGGGDAVPPSGSATTATSG
jgi:hypothetical protein